MTVDSQYRPEVYANAREVLYPFEVESIGVPAMALYKVQGAAYTLLTEGYHYLLEYGDDPGPIHRRGQARLAAPIAAGAHLAIYRRTPIVNPFTVAARAPFPSEHFEYAIDVICFIQQEIEGHACACPDYPDYIGIPPLPAEQPESLGG